MSSSNASPSAHASREAATESGAPSAAHTPGPWYVEQDGLPEMRNVGTYILSGHRHEGVLIADINTSLSDAHLIASAPDLLEALIDVLNDLSPIDYDDEVLEPGNGAAVSAYWMRPSVLRARAAIAKAETRS